ncbi:tetratricopeptide repeat protein [Paenibacillus sp. NEAU-GSW1]|uniref:tetratricopeptide repeat protein n=1 Tax=Paenibacillus sp. NEAU-GSW1 TaxID=2682486 RepID=UPI0015643BC8|nr:tetratricopeptide repeat protein [Paenibacillus sp. NEAU-GSW1]
MDGESCVKQAYAFILNNDFEQAIEWFERAIAIEPDNAGYHYKCAISCARSGKWNKAHRFAKQAVELDASHTEYQYYLQTIEAKQLVLSAEQLIQSNPPQYEEALDMLNEAAELDPLSFEAFYFMAFVHAELGNLDTAVNNAREAIRIDPGHSAARRLFADIRRKRRMMRDRAKERHRKRNR